LDLGFSAVGRPSCTGGAALLLELILANGSITPRDIVIVADDDGPGQRGARRLATALVSYVPSVRFISSPSGVKDAREWVRRGATCDDVFQAVEAAPALQLSYSVKAVSR
jgi:hypothetical protein